jgi:hypothetical protein
VLELIAWEWLVGTSIGFVVICEVASPDFFSTSTAFVCVCMCWSGGENWVLNSGLCTCKADSTPVPFALLGKYLPGLASNYDPPTVHVSLPSFLLPTSTPISASQVARIIRVSHSTHSPAPLQFPHPHPPCWELNSK